MDVLPVQLALRVAPTDERSAQLTSPAPPVVMDNCSSTCVHAGDAAPTVMLVCVSRIEKSATAKTSLAIWAAVGPTLGVAVTVALPLVAEASGARPDPMPLTSIAIP